MQCEDPGSIGLVQWRLRCPRRKSIVTEYIFTVMHACQRESLKDDLNMILPTRFNSLHLLRIRIP
jgi:hypothetical protein